MGEVIDLEEYRRRRRERRLDASGHTPEEACDILDEIFGLHTETRDSPCGVHVRPTATCRGRWNQR